MFIAMTYERNRLRRAGLSEAEIFDPSLDEDQPHAHVFDISSPALISHSNECSTRFAAALRYLTSNSVDAQHPAATSSQSAPTRVRR